MADLSIRPVARQARPRPRSSSVPYRLRRDDPQWVPPLRFERRQFLDRRKNPWFEHAEAELFLCEREGEAVGRISAHIDHRWDEFQGGNDGMFGFFDAEDDPEVAAALIDAAAGLAARARPRADARADGLHDERRVRDPDRGLRRAVDDPRALAPAVLPRRCSRGSAWARRSTC